MMTLTVTIATLSVAAAFAVAAALNWRLGARLPAALDAGAAAVYAAAGAWLMVMP